MMDFPKWTPLFVGGENLGIANTQQILLILFLTVAKVRFQKGISP
jgi:hypothetical protein